jgi:ubiquinone/menaquinone biosynthesis C-methylase UbiE
MNFQRTNTKISLLDDYYEHFDEDHRLTTRHGKVEFVTNLKYIDEVLNNDKTKKILDVGAGTGRYSIYYKKQGYKVTALELVQHNLDQIIRKDKDLEAYQGNALDLSRFDDESFDVVLIFGPMYHLFSEEDRLKVLEEAKRVVKKDGYILTSYYMNEYAVISYGFIKGNILTAKEEGRVDDSYHYLPKEDDLYSMVRIEDIDRLNEKSSLKRIKLISSDTLADYFRVDLNKMTKEVFEEYIKYHLTICERREMLGFSAHLLDIVQK